MSEIAETVGFSGASYMAEVFKKYYSMSPRDYRKSISAKNPAQ
ncbi:MAG: AraC family transcriptional regulator [Treponema sp.]|nr:AraC family transcriptional regulator [Treponema sp.]